MPYEPIGSHLPQPERTVPLLNVSPFEADHNYLKRIFSHSSWKLYVTRTCAEAAALLKRKRVPVVLSERELPDGTWRDILERTIRKANPPALIVSCRLADDRLWAEVLNLGGYNVLMKPFRDSEVLRDVSLAWLDWINRAQRARKARGRPRALGGAA